MATVIIVTTVIPEGEDIHAVDGINTKDFPESPASKPMPKAKKSTAPEGLWGDTNSNTRKAFNPYA
jgi:hypothetical protein